MRPQNDEENYRKTRTDTSSNVNNCVDKNVAH